MLETIGELQIPYCMMHMRGTPQTMKTLTDYSNITKQVLFYFSERVAAARSYNINDIIVDPGFGFAKTTDQNFELLNHLELFDSLDLPLLAGVSRKSMVYKTLDISPKEALNGTTALHMVALQKGARILRVHDVQPATECIKLFEQLNTAMSN
jgi:dihydropteroate synthase